MKQSIKIKNTEIQDLVISHQRVNGRYNVYIELKSNDQGLDLYDLTSQQIESLEQFRASDEVLEISIDPRFLELTEDQWLKQNGIVG